MINSKALTTVVIVTILIALIVYYVDSSKIGLAVRDIEDSSNIIHDKAEIWINSALSESELAEIKNLEIATKEGRINPPDIIIQKAKEFKISEPIVD